MKNHIWQLTFIYVFTPAICFEHSELSCYQTVWFKMHINIHLWIIILYVSVRNKQSWLFSAHPLNSRRDLQRCNMAKTANRMAMKENAQHEAPCCARLFCHCRTICHFTPVTTLNQLSQWPTVLQFTRLNLCNFLLCIQIEIRIFIFTPTCKWVGSFHDGMCERDRTRMYKCWVTLTHPVIILTNTLSYMRSFISSCNNIFSRQGHSCVCSDRFRRLCDMPQVM